MARSDYEVPNTLRRVSVLVVDDNTQITRLVKDVLNIFGFQDITIAHDGNAALKALSEKKYGFMVIDWQMRGMSGLECVDTLRKLEDSKNRFIPIIMLTGKADIESVRTARDVGITEFLVKPFTAEELKRRVVTIIDQPRAFVLSGSYTGPDRRRRDAVPADGVDRRKNRAKPSGKPKPKT
jgi:two-component system chemotaxis response regulator CheY